ncbi:MAG: molybdenum cofactor biosynthesis protein [Candidatus Epulonipiscioides saccharophilum]|nr:MAG: molybdenum cofactor biosynthesis protein [Epulopiscium sp. AS2M-Bin001]
MKKIMALCISEQRGTKKSSVAEVEFLEDYGIKYDAHGGDWHRQISLLDYAVIEEFKEQAKKHNINIENGDFGENIVTQGIDFSKLEIGTRLGINDVILEITQHGKECHDNCEIGQKVGRCIMPTSGVFAKVIRGGKAMVGDTITEYMPIKVGILVASDTCSANKKMDLSGETVKEILEYKHFRVFDKVIVPDEVEQISEQLKKWSDEDRLDLIITTGGTGFATRDVTPEATIAVIDKNVPGIAELIRRESFKISPNAILSRAVSGIRGRTLIINLPGSVKAVRENLLAVIDLLPHGIKILRGSEINCGRS